MELEESESAKVNFIPCVKWVRKGLANPNPDTVQLSKNELAEVINELKDKQRTARERQAGNENMETDATGTNDEFNMENYDDEEGPDVASVLGISSLAEIPTAAEENFSDSDDSEKEDDKIKSSDNLVLVGHVEGDANILEVYIYNEEEGSLYVHHDLLLSSYPMCLEWLNYEPNMPKGSYCAVGTMDPIIEVWDLDVVNCIQPAFTLGKKASRKKGIGHVGHTDAVLALAWNQTYDHVMASGSVDKTVLLWDMEKKMPSTTLSAFQDKVQCLEWHRMEAQTLLAGGCDQTAKVFDCRTPDSFRSWDLDGEAERLVWNPLQPFMFVAGTSKGSIQGFDCRKGQLWSVEAHEKEVTGLAISGQCPGLLVTSSPDGLIKTWDFTEEIAPTLVHEKESNMGYLLCLELCPDLPFVITAGGDNRSNNFCVYDLRNIDVVRHRFESRPLVQLESENDSQNQASPTSESMEPETQ